MSRQKAKTSSSRKTRPIITGFASRWPREIFDIKHGRGLIAKTILFLQNPGVYILYEDKIPYYIGRTSRPLFTRLRGHAINPSKKHYHGWNMFSAFAVPNKAHRAVLEGILIAAMPTANGAKPKLNKVKLPMEVKQLMTAMRQQKVKGLKEVDL